MQREVEHSNTAFTQSFLDVENIRIFRDVLHHGHRYAEEGKPSSSDSSMAPMWEQPDNIM